MIQIQAHRGASDLCPENTMAAFQKAIELGADGIELDVHKLFDGSLPVLHDPMLDRLFKEKGSIYHLSGPELSSRSAGAWFSPDFTQEKIPFFEEVLRLIKPTSLFLNIELKCQASYISHMEDDVLSLLDRYALRQRCILSSFDHAALMRIKQRRPEYKVGALYGELPHIDVAAYAKRMGFDAVHPDFQHLDKETVDRCHDLGIQVNVYTVNEKEDLLRMQEYGVDTIITNHISLAKDILI